MLLLEATLCTWHCLLSWRLLPVSVLGEPSLHGCVTAMDTEELTEVGVREKMKENERGRERDGERERKRERKHCEESPQDSQKMWHRPDCPFLRHLAHSVLLPQEGTLHCKA